MGMGAGMVHLVMTASPSKGAGSLAGERVKEPPTPQPHCQQRPEQNQGVDALAPLSRPSRAQYTSSSRSQSANSSKVNAAPTPWRSAVRRDGQSRERPIP